MAGNGALQVVIVGNGIGGVMTAARLRQLEPDPGKLAVEVYTREPYEYYSRIRLPELFHSGLTAEQLAVYRPGWYEERAVQVYKNQEVVRLEREAKRVVLKSGVRVPYDRLVLAMGADPYRPRIPNSELSGVFTVREYGDAEAIRGYVQAGTRHAVVIGGGLLGLEAARQLSGPGLESLTVLEAAPRLLPRQLDEPAAALLQRILERLPCTVLLGNRAVEFHGERAVHGLRLADGRDIPAETVLFCVGVVPRVGLAREAGLEVHRGIVVDSSLRSSDPDVFVVGDLVEFEGVVWGIIPAALDHAPVAAANLLGRGPAVYHQTIPQNTLKVAGIHLTSIGQVTFDSAPGGAPPAGTEEIARLDPAAERYEKYVLRDGRLAGAILLGSRQNVAWVNGRIGKETSAEEIRARL